ncbi:MAG: hypothetical protein K2K22_03225, partial [Muribaculaceae bacterium]|nr:hypothetical protein [Muribaculaceae bacterium]
MRKLQSLLSLALISAATVSVSAGVQPPHTRTQAKAMNEKFAGTSRMDAPARTSATLKADFTVEGADALAPVYT